MLFNFYPQLIQKIDETYVLWFEKSNSYVVISTKAHDIMRCFFESNTEEAFLKHSTKIDFSKNDALGYLRDITVFLEDVNLKESAVVESSQLQNIPKSFIPKSFISKKYQFGKTDVLINFDTDKISQLIHPYLEHAEVDKSKHVSVEFDIFSSNDLIYLFRNKQLIDSYTYSRFHFLQGKFSMQLVTSIYNNNESDWLATFHASTVTNGEEAIMIIGDSGNGKSTLSALLMAHGFDLLADDFTPMLSENQHLYRFPAAISIKSGAFPLVNRLFEEFQNAKSYESTSKGSEVKYLPPNGSFGDSKSHFACKKLVAVRYSKETPSQLIECSAEKILATFIPDSWISPNPNHSKKFLEWLKDLTFYELTYNDNAYAVKQFEKLFQV